MKNLRILPLAVAIIGIAVGTSHSAERFTVPGTSVSIEMPNTPQCQTSIVQAPAGDIHFQMCGYFDEPAQMGHAIQHSFLPATPLPNTTEQLLMAAAEGAVAASDSKIRESTHLNVNGHPALDIKVITPRNGFRSYSRYVLVDNQLIVATLDAGTNAAKHAYDFFETLEFSGAADQE